VGGIRTGRTAFARVYYGHSEVDIQLAASCFRYTKEFDGGYLVEERFLTNVHRLPGFHPHVLINDWTNVHFYDVYRLADALLDADMTHEQASYELLMKALVEIP